MIIPIGHESDSVRRLPWVTFTIMALCIIMFAFTDKADTSSNDELIDVWKEIVNYYSQHPYLEINPPEDMELNSGQKYIIKMLKESSSGKEKSDELTIIDEQVYLDDLFEKLKGRKKGNIIVKITPKWINKVLLSYEKMLGHNKYLPNYMK